MKFCLIVIAAVLGAYSATAGAGLSEADVAGNWNLVEGDYRGRPVRAVESYPISIALTADGVDRNRTWLHPGGGTFDLVEGDFVLSPELGFTEMACEQPVMEMANRFGDALRAVRTAILDGEDLALTGDQTRLLFRATSPIDLTALAGR